MKLSFFLDKNDVIQNEFNLDYGYKKYSEKSIFLLGNMAWDIGVLTALNGSSFARLNTVTKSSIIVPSNIIFSDYNSISSIITLYKDTIMEHFLPNVPSKYSSFSDYDNAVYLLKLHEYFHHLQCTNFNSISVFRMNCLNEIAAYAFSQKISGICFE